MRVARHLLLTLFALFAFSPSAFAYWSAGGAGTGSGFTADVAVANQPTVTLNGRTADVDWLQTQFLTLPLGGFAGGGYAVRRFANSNTLPLTPAGSCGSTVVGSASTISCSEASTPYGIWRYSVMPILNSWTGQASPFSSEVTVKPAAPASADAEAAPAAAVDLEWSAVPEVTGYLVYRRTGGGVYDYGAPLSGGSLISGTSFTDTTATSGVTYHYVVRAVFVFGATPLTSPDSPETTPVTADGTVPTGVSINDPGSPRRGLISLSGTATDTISGLAELRYELKPTTGTTWAEACVATSAPFGCDFDSTSVADGFYDFRVVAVDGVGNTATSAAVTNRRIDNTPPTVTLSPVAAYIRMTVDINATASDAGSGLAQQAIQYRPSGGAWTTLCSTGSTALSCSLNTLGVADGTYDFRAYATDVAGNENESVASGVVIDNTPPTVVNIDTTNAPGGQTGRPESGDTVVYTYSEAIDPATIYAGWDGSRIDVSVRLTYARRGGSTLTVYDAANSNQIAIGSVQIGNGYVSFWTALFFGSPVFSATMTMAGSDVTVTLGQLQSGRVSRTNGNRTFVWTGNTANTDLAGNSLLPGSATESGPNDPNF